MSQKTDNNDPQGFQIGIKLRTYNHSLDVALKIAQKKAGLNRGDYCSQVLGIHLTTIYTYLGFRAYPTEERILKIAIALEVPPDDLFPEALAHIRLEKQPEPVLLSLEMASQLGFGAEPTVPALDTDEQLDRLALPEAVETALETLTEQESMIIKLRFGFGEDPPKTLKEIGDMLNKSPEGIRRVEAKALRKLRHPRRGKLLNPTVKDEICSKAECRVKKGLTAYSSSEETRLRRKNRYETITQSRLFCPLHQPSGK